METHIHTHLSDGGMESTELFKRQERKKGRMRMDVYMYVFWPTPTKG